MLRNAGHTGLKGYKQILITEKMKQRDNFTEGIRTSKKKKKKKKKKRMTKKKK